MIQLSTSSFRALVAEGLILKNMKKAVSFLAFQGLTSSI